LATDTGANITWDYRYSFAPQPVPYDSLDFTLPATRSISCSNSSSNLADGNAHFHHCYIKNSYGLFETGYVENTGDKSTGDLIVQFSKPELLMLTGMKFRDSSIDTSFSIHNFSVNHSDSNYHNIDIKKMKYDGYGTLRFSGLTFDSVLRIHSITNRLDSVFISGSYFKGLDIIDKFEWYHKLLHVPLLTLYSFSFSTISGSNHDTFTYYYGYYMGPDTLGRTGIPMLIPGMDHAKVFFSSDAIVISGIQSTGLNCSLYDMAGKLVLEAAPQKAGTNKWILKTGNIVPGMYMLQLKTNEGNTTAVKLVRN
jgi:hypothetical protein